MSHLLLHFREQKILETAFDLVGLEDVEWKVIPLKSLFYFKRGNQNNMSSLTEGMIPLISAKKFDNGYKTFVEPNNKPLFEGDIITINNDGDGGVGIAYYQPHKMALDTHVTALFPKQKRTKHELLFLATAITKQRDKFSHGYSMNNNRIINQKIILPIDQNGNPHWKYMSQFMQKIEAENLEKALEYIYIYKIAISKGSDLALLEEKEWKEFWLEDLVDISGGRDIYARERIDGNTPYITATAQDNGIGYFVGNMNETIDKECISVNRNGSVGYAFYHEYPALYGNDTRKLTPNIKNRYISLFLTTSITNQKEKYGYGYKMGTGRLKRQKIMLPVTSDGQPDFEYMNAYTQIKEIEKQYEVLKYYYHLQEV